MTDARSPIRALRAALFAAICIALAATGHVLSSGHQLRSRTLLCAFAATAVSAWCAGGRRRGVGAIGGALLLAQTVLHLSFVRDPAGHTAPPTAGHHGPAPTGLADTLLTDTLARGSALLGPSPLTMTAAHLAAAAGCALWLARGEAALFRLARAAVALAFTPLRLRLTAVPLPVQPRPAVRPHAPAASHGQGARLASVLVRRGPPAVAVDRATALGASV
jgi:hypothetical protein